MDNSSPIIELKDIRYAHTGGQMVLTGLNLSIRADDRIGLMGPNGSGKTTLFHIIMGLLQPISGTVKIFGKTARTEKDFQEVRQRVGLMFQDADDQLFSPTVIEDVAFGPLNLGNSPSDAFGIARETLSFLGLDDFEDRITHKLSGGEKRLVALATVLAMSPDVLLLDEPTAGLDDATRTRLQHVLADLNLPYILISHEFDFLSKTTTNIYLMQEGKIITDAGVSLHQHYHVHVHGDHPHDHRHHSS